MARPVIAIGTTTTADTTTTGYNMTLTGNGLSAAKSPIVIAP